MYVGALLTALPDVCTIWHLKYSRSALISDEEVDGHALLSLESDEVRQLIPKLGPRKRMLALLDKLVGNFEIKLIFILSLGKKSPGYFFPVTANLYFIEADLNLMLMLPHHLSQINMHTYLLVLTLRMLCVAMTVVNMVVLYSDPKVY